MRIVIAGGGYAGIQTALGLERRLKGNPSKIQLIDRNEYHTLLPSLPEIISKRGFSIIYYKDIIRGRQIDFIQANIIDIDLDRKLVYTSKYSYPLRYEFLVLSLGSRSLLPNIPGLKEYAFQFNSIEDAEKIAEKISSKDMNLKPAETASIVIGGGGATGVEVAGEIASLIKKKNQNNNLRVALASPSLLAGFPTRAKNWAQAFLETLNVELLIGCEYYITEVKPNWIRFRNGRIIKTTMFIWAGGITALPLLQRIGLKTGYKGRVVVNKFLQVEGRENIFVLGDAALILDPKGAPVPTTAYSAEQHGKIAAQNIYSMIKNRRDTMKEYKAQSSLPDNFAVSIGADFAVSRIRGLDLYGYSASKAKNLIKMKYLKDIGARRVF